MIKIKLIVLIVFLLFITVFSYGQSEITKIEYEKAVDFANYKYVIYSLTNTQEKQKFIENCDCDINPTFTLIRNSIRKSKTKTIAFSKEFNKLKELNIDLNQKNVAIFLTDSIFSKNFNSKYNRVFNYGNQRKENLEFIKYKNDLSALLINNLNDYIVAQKVESNTEINSQGDEPIEAIAYTQKKVKWFDTIIFPINIPSIIISILLSFLLIGFLYLNYLKNHVSENVKKYVHRKVSGSYFDQRFDQNQTEVNNLKAEIAELKNQIQKLKTQKDIPSKFELDNTNQIVDSN